ncbi:MAG TPA: FIST N-terminal domain-containing protein, partial [Syntrophorhabdaceae bacterium]|nr:FIST N-terminal domain-containing protein [Syntrophorhabdaceae bacterium]
MKIEQAVWTKENGWSNDIKKVQNLDTQLILFFGSTNKLKRHDFIDGIKSTCPKAHILGCSTAGEIYGTRVLDDSIVATFIEFEKSSFMGSCVKLKDVDSSYHAGERLAKSIDKEGLVHVFVLSDGTGVNGSELVNGLARNLPKGVAITGGLAGNGEHFEKTLVFWDETPKKNNIAIVGFYGKNLRVGYGSMGGWDPFGPERLITKSDGNVLYELDGRSALEIYKVYLGGHASGLPATGLFFPLQIRTTKGEDRIVRTILSINEDDRSMT